MSIRIRGRFAADSLDGKIYVFEIKPNKVLTHGKRDSEN